MSFFKESARRLRFGVFVLPASSLLGRHCPAPVSQSTLCLHAYRSSLRRTQTCWAPSLGLNAPFLPEAGESPEESPRRLRPPAKGGTGSSERFAWVRTEAGHENRSTGRAEAEEMR